MTRAAVFVTVPARWCGHHRLGSCGFGWARAGCSLSAALPVGGNAAGWMGAIVFLVGLGLLVWSAATLRRAGTRIQTVQPTTTIVDEGPYRYSRNPIYVGMFLGLIGLSLGFDSLWLLITLVPFYFVIRNGVVAREEVYLERKFGDAYRAYKTRVRRWL